MPRRLLLLAALVLPACGPAEGPLVSVSLSASRALLEDAKAVSLWFLEPLTTNGVELGCAALQAATEGRIRPENVAVVRHGVRGGEDKPERELLTFPIDPARLDEQDLAFEVRPGVDLIALAILYADEAGAGAQGADDLMVATACEEGLHVRDGELTEVRLTVLPFDPP